MENKNILVTGGYGFIGSNFINHLIDNYDNFNLINLDYCGVGSSKKNVKTPKDGQSVTHYQWDIAHDITKGKELDLPFDYLFHFAAESHVDRSISSPMGFVHSNVAGTLQVLEMARRIGVKRVILVSTDEVTGSIKTGSTKEFAKYDPSSVYSATKASAEMLAKAYYKTHGMDVVTTRCSNNFGPNQFEEKLIPKVIKNALSDKKIPIYDEGLQRREWTYVEDHVKDLIVVAEHGKKGEIYNVGDGFEFSNIDIVKRILNILDKTDDLLQFVPNARKGHDFRYSIDLSKIKKLKEQCGIELNIIGFEERLDKTINYYKNND